MEKENLNTYKSEREFITEVAKDCVKNLSEKDTEYFIENPCATTYHHSYGMYIRNHYIYNQDFTEAPFFAEPDHLSSEIIKMIFSMLLPEYDYDDAFIEWLYDNEKFLILRKEYKEIYGTYPVSLVEKYKMQARLDPETVNPIRSASKLISEFNTDAKVDILEKNYGIISKIIDSLIRELAELVWRTEELKKIAEEKNIPFDLISKNIENLKNLFFKEGKYLPLPVCFLPYRKQIGEETYIKYRQLLSDHLKEDPYLVEKLDPSYFHDQVLAKSVLKQCGWTLNYMPMYQNDDKMVRYCLEHDGTAIEYADKRFWQDRKWVEFAILHAKTIMHLDCMKPYRKDKELVYLACRMDAWNFIHVDSSFRDDFELAKFCMEQKQARGLHSIYPYMSRRLRDNKELAMMDLEDDSPHTEDYSKRLRNDNEIAAKLYELHGTDAWAWDSMSKRLKKKYGIKKLEY